MKCVLLGGSNSILKYGLRSGLESRVEVKRFALGATSCIQNLYELTRNSVTVTDADFVVTESNVNDSYFACESPLSTTLMEGQIDEYYRVLSTLNRNVYVVILPANHRAKHMESLSVMQIINERHRLNCKAHGFKVIDLEWVSTDLPAADVENLIPHPRHLHEGYLHLLGMNIADHAQSTPCSLMPTPLGGPIYSILTADELSGTDVEDKENSNFNERVGFIRQPIQLPATAIGLQIVAISAWSNGYSLVRLQDQKNSLVKCFSKLYSVWELAQPLEVSDSMRIETAYDNPKPTDNSRMSKYNTKNQCLDFGLVGLLLKEPKKSHFTPVPIFDYCDLDISKEVSPDIFPYIKAYHSFLHNRNLVSAEIVEELKNKITAYEIELAEIRRRAAV